MQKLIIIFLVLFVCKSTYTQDFWMEIPLNDSIEPHRIGQNANGELFLTTNHGVYRSLDGGVLWEHTGNLDEYTWGLAFSNEDILYAGYSNLYKSNNSGAFWELITQNINIYSLFNSNTDLLFRGEAGGDL